MPAPTAADVRAAIHAAWRNSVRPPDNRVSAPTYDDEGVSAYFAGRPWQGHEVEALRYHSVGLSFFTAEAFCYYLAAYLLAVLEDLEAADTIYDGILFHLSPTQLGKQWADDYRTKIAGFTEEQKRAVVAYLAWCADRYEPGAPWRQEIEDTITYLTSGQVRAADSPAERLLALSGDMGPAAEVRWLRLSHTTVTDEDLAGLEAFTSLRELDLGGAPISDAGLAQLSAPGVAAALAGLVKLDLSGGKQLSAEGLRHLAALRGLTELQLPNADLDDTGLRALAKLALRSLNLVHCKRLTEEGWRHLDVSALEELAMFGVVAPDGLLERLGAAGKLRELTCKSISETGAMALAGNPALVSLEVSEAGDLGGAASAALTGGVASSAGASVTALEALARLPALRACKLGNLACTQWPPGWPALVELTLLSGELSAEAAAGLARLPALRELGCFGERLAAGALRQLARSSSLRKLDLWCEDLDDARLLELAGSGIEQLGVHRARIGNAALAVVGELPALAELQLDGLALDDEAMRLLARAPRLRTLQLEAMPIGDAGLLHLAACPALRTLRLSGTKVTPAGIAALERAAPELELLDV